MVNRALIELLRGKGAHADPLGCVEDLSAELAARHVAGFPHSIGQLAFHMNFWMDYDLRRIRGEKPPYPAHSSESFPSDPTPRDAQQWDDLRKRFATLLLESAALAESTPEQFECQIEAMHPSHKDRAATLDAVLWQLVTHNSYHAGQIVTIRRMLGAWPPRAGGDTW
jgi:uncharacterized damage-inducible protein DinB